MFDAIDSWGKDFMANMLTHRSARKSRL